MNKLKEAFKTEDVDENPRKNSLDDLKDGKSIKRKQTTELESSRFSRVTLNRRSRTDLILTGSVDLKNDLNNQGLSKSKGSINDNDTEQPAPQTPERQRKAMSLVGIRPHSVSDNLDSFNDSSNTLSVYFFLM